MQHNATYGINNIRLLLFFNYLSEMTVTIKEDQLSSLLQFCVADRINAEFVCFTELA